MSRRLDDLDAQFKPIAFELLARTVEAGIPVMIINTRRTTAEQAIYLSTGASSVQHSKHQDGLAIDVCPYSQWLEFGEDKLQWCADDPQWPKLGAIGEALGLRSGRRWKDPHDPGHFEMLLPGERYKDIPRTSAAWAMHGIPGGGGNV